MNNTHTFSSKYWHAQKFLGKSIQDNKGNDCGKIQFLLIDPNSFLISGIIAKKRLSKEYFISKEYFDKITPSGLHLNSTPLKPNDKVVDSNGKSVGKIIKINFDYNTNKLESIEVKSRLKSKIILAEKIIGVGEKITVNL